MHGASLSIPVFFDAFVVRMALIDLLGEKAWYRPCWLDRLLPDVDVKAAKLERPHLRRPEVAADEDEDLLVRV